MRFIYHYATRVLIWLGEGTPDSDLAIRVLSKFQSMPQKKGGNAIKRDKWVSKRLKEIRVHDRNSKSPLKDILEDLFRRSWFRRVWTVQEVGVARHALLQCGSSTIPWEVFVLAVHRLSKYTAAATGSQGTEGRLSAVISLHQTVSELLSSRSNYPSLLTQLLSSTYDKEATEPKDRVLALYGILGALAIDFSMPDYNKSLEEVYREAAAGAIEHDKSLLILCNVDGFRYLPSIPTWAPAVSEQRGPYPISFSSFQASTHESECQYSFADDGLSLKVAGKRLDTIRARSGDPAVKHDTPEDFDRRVSFARVIDRVVRMFQDWIYLSCTPEAYPEYISGDSYPRAFMRLLVQDGSLVEEGFMKLPRLEEGGLEWYGLITASFPNVAEGFGMDMVEERLEKQKDVYPRIPSWLPKDLHHLTESDEWKIMQAIEQDPKASFFSGHAVPLSRGKAFFTTEKGYMGTTSYAIAIGDHIILVSGLSIPLVMRQKGDTGLFMLMGPAVRLKKC